MTSSHQENNAYLSEKTLAALEFAALAHHVQTRKGAKHIPYISHPAMVGTILARAGFIEEVVIAGILHDIIEDTEFGYEDIAKRFGKQVADLVQDVSEDKSLPYLERKQLYLDRLKTAPEEALAVSMADSMANLMSIEIYEHIYQEPIEGHYKNAVMSLVKYGDLKLEIVSSRMQHPLIDQWKVVLAKAAKIAADNNA